MTVLTAVVLTAVLVAAVAAGGAALAVRPRARRLARAVAAWRADVAAGTAGPARLRAVRRPGPGAPRTRRRAP